MRYNMLVYGLSSSMKFFLLASVIPLQDRRQLKLTGNISVAD